MELPEGYVILRNVKTGLYRWKSKEKESAVFHHSYETAVEGAVDFDAVDLKSPVNVPSNWETVNGPA